MTTVGSDSSETSTGLRRYKFREAVRTDIGLRRNENQDAYGIAHTSSTSLFIVADGMGGARGGATASALAVNVITNSAIKENGIITRPSLQSAIEQANQIINSRSKRDEDLSGMGTTVVALAFVNECAIVAHVGDSRIYRLRDGAITQLTHDHTLVQELVDTGAIPIEEAENHPIAHMLTRSLGPTDSVEVEIQALVDPTQRGDRFLLCSDGLYNLVSEAELAEHLGKGEPDEVVDVLVDLALERGGTDNVTVEVLEVFEIDDGDLAVDYPPEGEVRIAISEGVDVGDIDGILSEHERAAQQDQEILEALGQEDEPEDRSVSDSTEPDLERILDEDLPFEEPEEPEVSTAKESPGTRSDLLRIQAGVFFVIGLTAGVLLYSIYQYKEYGSARASRLAAEQKAPLPEGEQREELARQLETWATDRLPQDEAAAGRRVLPPQFPSGSMPSAVEPPTPAAIDTALPDEELSSRLEELQVPPPPDVVIKGSEEAVVKPDRPIVWENEERRVERLLEELAAQKEQIEPELDVDQPKENAPADTLLSADEMSKIVYQKNLLRERIADVDAKLRNLGLEAKPEAEALREEINSRIEELNDSIDERLKTLKELEAKLQVWLDYGRQAVGKQTIRFAETLAEQNPELKKVKDAYDKSSASYFEAFDRWQEQPNDVKRAADMGARGRELQQAQIALETSIRRNIDEQLEQTARTLAREKLEQAAAETERDKLSRQEGYLRAYTVSTPERRKELKATYLEERAELTEELAELDSRLSGLEEVKFSQSMILRTLLNR